MQTSSARPRPRASRVVLVVVAALTAWIAAPPAGPAFGRAAAAPGGDACLTTDPPPSTLPAHALRFGITPLAAGSAGASQQQPVPHDPAADLTALRQLRGRQARGRQLVLRLNRMFWSDGEAGLQRFATLVDRYAAAGFDSELQVRYHPPQGEEGDMAAWESYVRRAAAVLGARRSVVALTITNEANMSVSPNTSDGSYEGVEEAIVHGIVAARQTLDRLGRSDVALGFSFAWRWAPDEDADFWDRIGELATPAFRDALDYVGLQIYPGLVWPPAPLPTRSAGREVVEALTLLRQCYLPKADLGPERRPVGHRERVRDEPRPRRGPAGRRPALDAAGRAPLVGDPRGHRLPLVQPAGQPKHGHRPVRRRGTAARRRHPEAGVLDVRAGDRRDRDTP